MESTQLKSRSRLVGAGAIVLPVLAVLCVGYLAPKPASAKATRAVAATSDEAKLIIPSSEWLRSWNRGDAPSPIEGSPFPVEVVIDLMPDSFEFEDAPITELEPEPVITLTAIMRSASGDVAMVDGKALGIGARLVGSWIVGGIDARARTVTAVHEHDGREVQVRLKGL